MIQIRKKRTNRPCILQPNEEGIVRFDGLTFHQTDYPQYFVSRCGQVLSLRNLNPRRVSFSPNKGGYIKVVVYTNNGREKFYVFVHRLVAKAFIPNPENKPQVNHINAITGDNRVENLEWCTHGENMAHSSLMGLHRIGSQSSQAQIDEKIAHAIKFLLSIGMKQKTIAQAFKVSANVVWLISKNRKWKHVTLCHVDTNKMFHPDLKETFFPKKQKRIIIK